MKKLFFLITLCSTLFSVNEFKESRYIDVLNITQNKEGNIDIEDDILTIVYKKPKKETLIYEEKKLKVISKDDNKEYLFEEYPQLKYMGLLLKSIFTDHYENLDLFFKIQIKNEMITLVPKPSISYRINLIEIIKKDSKIKKIIFEMRNKDILTIETIN